MPLNPDDSRPPYLQIAEELRGQISRGALAPGAQLPSTNELVERYGVARGTVRSALRVLADEGLVVARHGSGVFVRSGVQRDGDGDDLGAVIEQLTEVSREVRRLSERVAQLEELVRPRGGDE